VPASVVMLLAVTALLTPSASWPKRIFAVVFVALAGYSSFLALRDTVIAPHDRLQELSAFKDEVSGQKVLALTSDRIHGLRPADGPGLEPRVQRRDPRPVSDHQEPAPADRLRLRADEGAQRLPLRGNHQRDLPEPGAAGLDAGRLDPVLPALEADGHNASDRQPLRGGPAGSHLPLQQGEVRAIPPRGRRGPHLAAAERDREAALLEGGWARRRSRRGWSGGREERPDRQPAEPGPDGESDDFAAAGQVGALAAVRQPGGPASR